MLPDVIVHRSDISFSEGGVVKDKKLYAVGAYLNKHGPTSNKDGMDTLFMVVSIVKRTCFHVVNPLGS